MTECTDKIYTYSEVMNDVTEQKKMLMADRKQNKTVSIQPPPPPPPTLCSLHSVVAPRQSWAVSQHHRQSPSPYHAPYPLRVGQIGQGGGQYYLENL